MDDFPWKADAHQIENPARSKISSNDFQASLDFLATLQWCNAEHLGVGFVELLFLFLHRGHKLEGFQDVGTGFSEALKHFKKAIVAVIGTPNQKYIPGRYCSTEAYKCGRALPKGAIFGTRPFFASNELQAFAALLLEGCGQNLATWSFPISACLT